MSFAFTTRAYVYGDGGGFYKLFWDFLYRVGYRDTTTFRDAEKIIEGIRNNIWPVIIVDSSLDEKFDTLGLLDKLYGIFGFELLQFVVMGSAEDRRYQLYHKALSASGFLQKPLVQGEATKFMASLLPPAEDKWTRLALEVSKLLLMRNVEGARPALVQLAANPTMEKGAEIALLRSEIFQGQFSRAEERLVRLLKKFPGDLRIYCEAVEYFKATSQIGNAVRFLKEIEKTKALPHRVWDRACLSLEIDDLDGVADAFDQLVKLDERYKHVAMRGYAQMFLFTGLQEYLPHFVKNSPALWKEYTDCQMRAKKSS